jgi:hypothetical protein
MHKGRQTIMTDSLPSSSVRGPRRQRHNKKKKSLLVYASGSLHAPDVFRIVS